MSKTSLSILVVCVTLVGVLFVRCGRPECANDLEHWVEGAPAALVELDSVRQGLLGDTAILKAFGHQELVFIHPRDTTKSSLQQNAGLMKWFRSGKKWIAIDRESVQACYKECRSGRYTAHGYLIQGKMPHGYSSAVEMVDSLYLHDGWYAHVTSCTGCGD